VERRLEKKIDRLEGDLEDLRAQLAILQEQIRHRARSSSGKDTNNIYMLKKLENVFALKLKVGY
jgi:dynactin complex subunit